MSDAGSIAAEQYNDGNRAFLQSFLARGTLTLEQAKPMIAAIYSVQEEKDIDPDHIAQADLESFVSAAAEAISPFDYEIRSTQHQVTKERVWALVNSVSDPLTQLATTRTTEEIHYIKRFLDAMFETYNTKRREIMAVSDMQALETKIRKGAARQSNGAEGTQGQAGDKGLTSDQTEKLLENLGKENWVSRSRGFYTLTPRALMELRGWLVETYNEPEEPEDGQRIKFCEACKEIVTIGQRCSDLECHVRLHNICEEAFWSAHPGKKCARCDTPWDGKHFVGPKAVTVTEDNLRAKQRRGISKRRAGDNGGEGSSRKRKSRTAEASEEEEQEEEEEEEEEESSRNGGRAKRRPQQEEAEERDSDE